MTTKKTNTKQTTLGERLTLMLGRRGMSQGELARVAGMKQQSVNYLINPRKGGDAKSEKVVELAQALGADPVWLATGHGSPLRGAGSRVPLIPMSKVAEFLSLVGNPTKMLESGLLDESISCDRKTGPESFAVRITDTANAPSFHSGSVLILDARVRPQPGDLCLGAIGQSQELVIRVYRPRSMSTGKEEFDLSPINPMHLSYNSSEVKVALVAGAVEIHQYSQASQL